MKAADLLMSTAKLIVAAGFKMKEQARQEMAEEDLGGGMFDRDVRDMRDFASKCNEPQVYENDERQQLDESIAFFNKKDSLKKYNTGTNLYTAHVTDTVQDVRIRVETEVRAPVEQIISYCMGKSRQFNEYNNRYSDTAAVDGPNDHNMVVAGCMALPHPFQKRHVITKTLWEKLDDNSFFVSQICDKHSNIPAVENSVATTHKRCFKLTRVGPSLTK
jgi:hypothetical protein